MPIRDEIHAPLWAIPPGDLALRPPKSKTKRPGDKFKRRGQTYRFAAWRVRITRRGQWVLRAVLTSRCADCGEGFVTEATKGQVERGALDRRCKRHRRVGRPAKKQQTRPSRAAAGPSRWEKELIG